MKLEMPISYAFRRMSLCKAPNATKTRFHHKIIANKYSMILNLRPPPPTPLLWLGGLSVSMKLNYAGWSLAPGHPTDEALHSFLSPFSSLALLHTHAMQIDAVHLFNPICITAKLVFGQDLKDNREI